MMETRVSLGAHCLLLPLGLVMLNLPCFMVLNGCHRRYAFQFGNLIDRKMEINEARLTMFSFPGRCY